MAAVFTPAAAVQTSALETGDLVVVPEGNGPARFAVVEGLSDFTVGDANAFGGPYRTVYAYDAEAPMRLVKFLAAEDGSVDTVTTDTATQAQLLSLICG